MAPRLATLLVLLATASGTNAEPTRFAPGAVTLDRRITLTPAFSPDGNTVWYAQSRCSDIGRCPQTLFRAERLDGVWQAGQAVALPQSGRVDWPSVSPDGRTLYFSWSATRTRYAGLDVDEDFDLYQLDLTRDAAVPEALDVADINRPRAGQIKRRRYFHNSTGPIMTDNGDLYFWTERADGVGERDIYVAPRRADGGYDIARPLPAPINSTARDHLFWIAPDASVMLITYRNRDGKTGNDLYVSRRDASGWTPPVNLGPTVNTPYDEFAPRVSPDGTTLLFTSNRPFADQPPGLLQVWQVPIAELIDAGTLNGDDF